MNEQLLLTRNLKETFLTCRSPMLEPVYWKQERLGAGSHSITSHSQYLEKKEKKKKHKLSVIMMLRQYTTDEHVHFCQQIADTLTSVFCIGTFPKVYTDFCK